MTSDGARVSTPQQTSTARKIGRGAMLAYAGLGPLDGVVAFESGPLPPGVPASVPTIWCAASDDAALVEFEIEGTPICGPEPIACSLPGEPIDEVTLNGQPVMSVFGQTVCIASDLPAFFFACLSRAEEVGAALDKHGRFDLNASALRPWLQRPVLDWWAHALRLAIGRAGWALPRIEIAGGWHATLTHDVDHIDHVAKRPAASLEGGLVRKIADRLGRGESAGERALRVWSDLERKHGWRGTYYFLGQLEGTANRGYEVSDERVSAAIRRLDEQGHEIGLHASYDAMTEPELLAGERDRIATLAGRTPGPGSLTGVRSHYLRYVHPATAYAHRDAGFAYDASLGYTAETGYRAGTSRPFDAIDPADASPIGLTTVPFAMMDCSYLSALKLTQEQARERVTRQLEETRTLGGAASLLFHPCRLTTDGDPYDHLFRFCLDELNRLGATVLTAGALAARYRAYAEINATRARIADDHAEIDLDTPEGIGGIDITPPADWELTLEEFGGGVRARLTRSGA
ncbi:MAG: hypothetical protein RIB32_00905 [Phycisphaerales bacterium]